MSVRRTYEMTEEDLLTLLEACKPVPAIYLHCGSIATPQERVNAAWEALGNKMGFYGDTAAPINGKDDRFFTAIVKN
jgi:hypothetical protein